VNAVISILAQAKNEGGGIFGILILVLPLAALFYLMVIPQRKQRQKHQTFVASLTEGDEVVTSGGLHGTITHIEGGVVHLEIDTDVVVRVSLSSLSRSASDPEVPVRGRGVRAATASGDDAAADEDNGDSPK
jgi:preprotein translocase subunit YajC